jgi:hypothetical protein
MEYLTDNEKTECESFLTWLDDRGINDLYLIDGSNKPVYFAKCEYLKLHSDIVEVRDQLGREFKISSYHVWAYINCDWSAFA